MHSWRLLLPLLLLASRPTRAQSADGAPASWLELTVVDSLCRPLPGVTVILADTYVGVSTNAEGRARLYLRSFPDSPRHRPTVLLELQQWPYRPQRLRVGLRPTPRDLGEVTLRTDWVKLRAAEHERLLYPPVLIEMPPPEPVPVEELPPPQEPRTRPPAKPHKASLPRRVPPQRPARRQ